MEYKGYNIVSDPEFHLMKRIEYPGRGSIHLQLRGMFSTVKDAKKAIDMFKDKD